MALPVSRNTTYAPGSQIKSADLNDVQDKIIDLNGRFDAEETSILGGKGSGSGATFASDGSITSATTGTLKIPIELPVGTEITSVDVVGLRTGAANPTYGLHETVNSTGATSVIATVAGTSASRESLSIAATNKVLLTGRSYSLEVLSGASATATVFMVTVFWKRDP